MTTEVTAVFAAVNQLRGTAGRILPMLRHHEVTRIEGFSDAVFGFALTLLVVQLEVPKAGPAQPANA